MKSKLKTQRINNTFIITLYALLFGFMLIGTFYDLEIDKILFNYNHPFAVSLAVWGMAPQYSICFFAYTLLLACYHSLDDTIAITESLCPIFAKLKTNKITHAILFIIHKIIYCAFFYGAFSGADELLSFIIRNSQGYSNLQDLLIDKGVSKVIAIILWTILRLLIIAIAFFIFRKFDKKILSTLELMAFVGLIIYILYICKGGLNAIKGYFHRIRFREMIAQSAGLFDEEGKVHIGNAILNKSLVDKTDFSWFTRWYQIGKDNGVKWNDPTSFPSGHTTGAGFSMLLIPIAHKLNNKVLYLPLAIIGFGYTAMVGLSRLIRGAHYLTDVSAAAIIMLTFIIILTSFLTKIQNYSINSINKINK